MARLDVGSMIASFKIEGGLPVTRRAAGSYVKGLYVPGASSSFVLDPVIVQPAGKKEVARLPEGLRTREAIALHTTVELFTADDPGGRQGDQILYNGKTYEVQAIENWSAIVTYYYCIATKVPTA